MTNNRLLVFIAIVLSILTIAVIWVGITFSKSQTIVTATEQAITTPVLEETVVSTESLEDKTIIQEPVNRLIPGVDYVEESDLDDRNEPHRSGTGVYYDESSDYHPATGEPLYWVDGVEVSGEEWYKATGGAQEGRSSLEEIEEMRRDDAPSQFQ